MCTGFPVVQQGIRPRFALEEIIFLVMKKSIQIVANNVGFIAEKIGKAASGGEAIAGKVHRG